MTHGKIEYKPKHRCWWITCEPQVAMRLKRVFGKLDSGSMGRHEISDTPENARDLQWFTWRYNLDFSAVKDRLYARAKEHRDTEQIVDEILSGVRAPLEFSELAIPAREYQKTAAQLLLARRGLLLADDVGLGKTASAICTFLDERTLPATVVTLTHLPRQWQAEIVKSELDTLQLVLDALDQKTVYFLEN